jgi:hypothetical protein
VSGPNQAIISIPSGAKANLLGLTKGVYVFQLKVIDNGWMSDSAKVTVTVSNTLTDQNTDLLSVDPTSLSIQDSTPAANTALGIYPNPVTGAFTLTITNAVTGNVNVQLIDAIGNIRQQYSYTKELQTEQYAMSASNLAPGVYFLRVQTVAGTQTLKMVQQ